MKRLLDARIVLGPILTCNGEFFLVSSPRFHQDAMAKWHSLGGHLASGQSGTR